MTDMEKRKFEDSFKDAFKDAEVSPSDNVWTNIELELEKEAGEKNKKKLFFYKLLAAASITFALLVTGIGLYMTNQSNQALKDFQARNHTPTLPNAHESEVKPSIDKSPPVQLPNTSINPGSERQPPLAIQSKPQKSKEATEALNPPQIQTEESAVKGVDGPSYPLLADRDAAQRAERDNGLPYSQVLNSAVLSPTVVEEVKQSNGSHLALPAYPEKPLPVLYEKLQTKIALSKPLSDPVALMMARLAAEESALASEDLDKRKADSRSEKIWTSVGFAAGAFNSVNHSVTPTPSNVGFASVYSNQHSSVPDKQARASGVAYSMGFNFGTKLAKRWVLQGGVNYLTQSSDYVATNVVADNNYQSLKAESLNSLEKLPLAADAISDKKLAPTAPYTVNNNVKFFSLPVQAGYLVVNRKFGIQLNAGLSSDFFMQNTITPQSGSLDKTTQGRGADSPYRSVNFSGLAGTEFSYRLGQRYRISLNPGLRYPLNSVYKSDVGIQSTPVTFDVGLRFRYIFQ